MKKQRIVLASVLKPIDDTRMFEKLGKSLARVTDYEVTIIGYPSKKQPDDASIHFLPHPFFSRLSLQRALIPLLVLKKTYKVRPEILIVNTHELLIVATLIRILFGSRIVYDVQENYWRNILWTDTFPPIIRHVLALWVRGKEKLLSPVFQLVILAEKCFEDEMKFLSKNAIVLENKSSLPKGFTRVTSREKIRLLFSGTISTSTGVIEAINLAVGLHAVDNSIELCMIGYCAVPDTLQKIRRLIHDKPFIILKGGDQPVPHQDIIEEISHSDFGLIYYPPSPHTQNRIPTKLYEYLSAQLPILLDNREPWISLCAPYPAAIPVDFHNENNAHDLLHRMRDSRFYTIQPVDVFWSSEEALLLERIGFLV